MYFSHGFYPKILITKWSFRGWEGDLVGSWNWEKQLGDISGKFLIRIIQLGNQTIKQ